MQSLRDIVDVQSWEAQRNRAFKAQIEREKMSQQYGIHRENMYFRERALQVEAEKMRSQQIEEERNRQAQLEIARETTRRELRLSRENQTNQLINDSNKFQQEQQTAGFNAGVDLIKSALQSNATLLNSLVQTKATLILRNREAKIEKEIKELDSKLRREEAEHLHLLQEEERRTQREFEILKELLGAEIHKSNFTHDEIIKLVVRMASPEPKDDMDDLMKRAESWMAGIKY